MSFFDQNQLREIQLEKEKSEAQKKTEQQAMDRKKIQNAAVDARANMRKDFDAGKELGEEILGDGLGRLKDDAGVQDVRSMLKEQASGVDSAVKQANREEGIRQIQGQQQSASRSLGSSLARSGVKGGAAGQANVELAAQGLNARRALETDLFVADKQAEQQGVLNLANFETKTTEFDLSQAAAEKNILLQSQLASAQIGSNERSAVVQGISAERIAEAGKEGGKK